MAAEEHVTVRDPCNGPDELPPSPPAAVVVGGGLAGLTSALILAEAGCRVTLLESQPYLGGKAVGFVDAKTGKAQEHSMRVYMGCYFTLLGILRRLEAAREGGGTAAQQLMPVKMEYLTSASAAPMGLSALANHYDIGGEMMKTAWALMRSRFGENLHELSMQDWFGSYGISKEAAGFANAVMGVWTGAKPRSRASTILDSMFIVLLSMLNADADSSWAEKAFKMATLGNPHAENQLFVAFPTSATTIEPIRRRLVELGVAIHLNRRVVGMRFSPASETTSIAGLHVVDVSTGEAISLVLSADAFVLATDVANVQRLCPKAFEELHPRVEEDERGEWSVGCNFPCESIENLPDFVKTSRPVPRMVLDSPWHIVYCMVRSDAFACGVGGVADSCPSSPATLFVTASNFEESPGRLFGKPALLCTPFELKLEYLEQLGITGQLAEELAREGSVGLGVEFVSPEELQAAPWRYEGCTLGPELEEEGGARWVAKALLYIETKHSPDVGTEVPGYDNLFLAGEYISSRYTRIKVPTMEKSAETGVLAARAAIKWLQQREQCGNAVASASDG